MKGETLSLGTLVKPISAFILIIIDFFIYNGFKPHSFSGSSKYGININISIKEVY